MPVPYAASRQDVKINLGYIASRSVSYLKRAMFHISPILLATYTQPEPTVFDAVMRTYLACWQGNFGLGRREHEIAPRRGTRGQIEGEHEAVSAGHLPEALRRVADDVAHRERLGAELDLSRLDPGQIEQVGDHPAEPIGVVPDPGEVGQGLLGKRAGHAGE